MFLDGGVLHRSLLPVWSTAPEVLRGPSSDLIVQEAWGARPHLWALTSCVLSLPHSSLLLPCLVEALQQILVHSKRLPFAVSLLSMKKPWAGGRRGTRRFFPPETQEHTAMHGAPLPLWNRWRLRVCFVPHALLRVGNTVLN